MKEEDIKLLQESLIKEGYQPGTVDGKLGTNTYGAVNQALQKRADRLPAGWSGWPDRRKAVAYLQLLCAESQIEVGDIDGYWGHVTDHAVETLAFFLKEGKMPEPWRDQEPDVETPPTGATAWPREKDVRRFYGEPGKNLTQIQLPYPHKLAWDLDTTIKSYACHEKVHDSLQRVLQRVLDQYGLERIQELRLDWWGGCFANRNKRGGSSLSMHSWGIAIDYDPERNQLKWKRDRAVFARPEYEPWWQCWEAEGWVSLGRTRNFDWMHVQAARL